VLLTIRVIGSRFEGYSFSAWLGVECKYGGQAVDMDLLTHGPHVVCLKGKGVRQLP
jgi:hypothetical protein